MMLGHALGLLIRSKDFLTVLAVFLTFVAVITVTVESWQSLKKRFERRDMDGHV